MWKIAVLIFIALKVCETYAFVENVSHGYPNCMACHVSPTGGGTLNDYGRSLSKELMSTWSWNKSEQVLFGALPENEKLKIGGDIRWIQSHFENSNIRQGRNFLMQQNIELAYHIAKTWIVGSFGTIEGPKQVPQKGEFLSERHYLLSEWGEGLFVRVGKFKTQFGVNDPNHNRFTRSSLGFGAGSETYNLEISKFSENDELFIGTSLGRLDTPREKRSEKNINLTYARYFGEKNKVGVSGLFGESPATRRSLVGVFGVLALPWETTLVVEVDIQRSYASLKPEEKIDGIFSNSKWMLEPFKGVKPYAIAEYRQNNMKDKYTMTTGSGLGLQWLPIPHIELQMEFQKLHSRLSPNDNADSAWALAHYYF